MVRLFGKGDDMVLREAARSELESLLELNQAHTPHVGSEDSASLLHLFEQAAWFLVVEIDGETAGFVLAMIHGADYHSLNYTWFQSRYDEFVYVDRIVVAPGYRRRGLATRMYDEIAKRAVERRIPVFTCEYNLHPPNEISAAFHARYGFEEVGTQQTDGGAKTVSLQAKSIG